MPFLTQFQSFFIPTFGEPSVCEELNKFLKSHRIINVEKHLINSDTEMNKKITQFTKEKLKLTLKPAIINTTINGVPF